jgi:hypothetical protein
MAARETMGTDVSPGLIARVATGIRYAVSGVGPMNWFGPQQPIQPQAQERAEGRAFDYPVGYNLRIQPREGEPVGFGTLRALADGYDLLRLVIETRKDQIEAFEWEIVPRDKDASADAMKGEIRRITDFLESPDKEHDWPQWLRMQIEDLLVLDALAVYPRMNRGGTLYGFELIDPSTLKRIIDDTGRTPLPPDVAYQQVLKGISAVDYSADQIAYTMRNPRTNRIYGYGPVEQVMMTVNIALRRQLSQLDFYTQGNIPEAIAQVPEGWTAKQIQDFQTWWDSVLEGNQAQKRKMRFVPSLDNIVFPKEQVLKDEYDEWLARIVCFAFSISPSALIKQVNRASGEQMADTAKEEGLLPLLRFFESHMTRLIRRYLGAQNLKFQFKVSNRVAPLDQASIHKIYADLEVITPDEIREEIGLDGMTPEQREEAFPTPVMPGLNPDGTPILPKGAPGAQEEQKPLVDPTKPSAVEKMLADALRMLDPSAISKIAQNFAPNVIHVAAPEVNVEVGDTNIHVPVPRATTAEVALAKRDADTLTRVLESNNDGMQALAKAVSSLPAPTVNIEGTTINVEPAAVSIPVTVEPAAVSVPVTVNTPDTLVKVDAPVTVQPAEVQVDVHMPADVGHEERIVRNDQGEVDRVIRKPLKP